MFPENRFMEVLIIGALALIVIGPKDLPIVLRKLGQFMGKMRAMAAEFRASFDELARQSELDELRREVDALRNTARLTDDAAPETGVIDEIKNNLSLRTPPVMTPLPSPEPVAAPSPPVTEAAPVAAAPAPEAAPKPARKPRAKAAADPAKTPARKSSTSATGSPT
jgi:sec-independent protein translocase protein TatB